MADRNICSLSWHPTETLAGEDLLTATRDLAEHLIHAPEIQAYIQARQILNEDAEAQRLTRAIRACRASFSCAEVNRYQAELEALPAMINYHRAREALRELLLEVEHVVSTTAGVEFIANVRPDRHG
ncbi:MAG TPA: YlbF family regulator [Anaerolinea thermolimosa]|uniref:YlbF family regulator n=1 Tax=Anaerolinea thermolimosa TaxID=229919 RepID=A0A3D1JGW8_9CHLR|nr:YlbF family regulator [Anaerolinea thermolimosa]GAP07936.1 uncharacterized conserved protein [Anaerolinea thermolimosa]HCE17487.1 YlbF family regulator [Anaerolinea thermolimosa]